jgi:RNA polymerase sigma factor (sigma-70 family)
MASVDVETLAIGAAETARLRAVLDALPPDQRDVLLMRVLADLSIEQTAAALGKTDGAVKQLQRRALISVRESLGAGVTL